MKRLAMFWVMLALVLVAGCNQIGRKDEVLARVAGSEIMESELEFALGSVPPARRSAPDSRAMVFGNILETRVRAEAGRRRVPQAASFVEKKLKNVRNRDLAQIYQRFYLFENLGHTEDQLLAWYRKNQQRFKVDSGKTQDFLTLRDSVAMAMTIEENRDSVKAYFEKNKAAYRTPGDSTEPTFEKVRDRVESAFIQEWRQKLMTRAKEDLRKKYAVTFVALPEPDAQDFYKKHTDQFKTAQAYKVLHLEMSDSSKLATLAQSIQNEADFKAKAAAVSENPTTKAKSGEVGVIKEGHCLPHGIGMMPMLFSSLGGRAPGFKTEVLQAPDTKKYHAFWLQENIAPKIKPYDRAKKSAIEGMRSGGEIDLDSNVVLVTMTNKQQITERDQMLLREEVPPAQRRYYTRDKLLEFLVDWAVFARAAQEMKLDKSPQFKAVSNLRSDEAWGVVFRDSVMYKTMGMDQAVLQKLYKQNPGKVFGDKDFEAARGEVAMFISIPDYFYKREFAIHPERYEGKKDWVEAKTQIFSNIRQEQVSKNQDRFSAKLRRDFGVEILDSALAQAVGQKNAQQMLDEARKQYDSRKLAEARAPLYDLRTYYSEDDSLMPKATMLLAQIFNEEEQFNYAIEEFTVMSALWPNHPDAYKALFMKGFILTENLKKDTLALVAFKELLKKYPKTDLADDADWMVRNIESGGKLVPALLDSIAKQDSLEAKKATPPGKPASAPKAP